MRQYITFESCCSTVLTTSNAQMNSFECLIGDINDLYIFLHSSEVSRFNVEKSIVAVIKIQIEGDFIQKRIYFFAQFVLFMFQKKLYTWGLVYIRTMKY